MILLDTNVISEAQKTDGNAVVKRQVAAHQGEIVLSTVVLGEIRFGIEQLEPGARRTALELFTAGLEADYADRIYGIDLAIAYRWGRMRAARRRRGRPLALADGLIAATAAVHDLTLWTRNAGDFQDLDIRVMNPWEG
ncbi:MAG: PIN domain-containing protein [Pseudomonadota bacterium]